jgi:protein ImuB
MAQGSITRKRAMFVWLPNFAMTLARLRKPPLAKPKEPLVLVEKYGNIRRIAALDGPAAEAGLYLHQPLADALAICPELTAADTEPEALETTLAALAAWAQRYSPFTAPAGASGLWLDIAGCAHLWGGEAACGLR